MKVQTNELAAAEVVHPQPEFNESQIAITSPTRLTLETLLYALIVILGLALRVWNLGEYPLSGAEAHQSLAALQLYRGEELAANSYSPLLVTLNGLIFLLFSYSDTTARLATALIGSFLIAVPATLRRQLGSKTCLLAAVLLAISPSAVFLSRTLNSQIVVAAGALLVISGFFNWAADGQKRWLFGLAAGAAIALTAGSMAYTVLIVFAVIAVLKLSHFKLLWSEGLKLSTETQRLDQRRDGSTNKPDETGLNPHLRQAAIFFVVAFVLLATAATFNLSGLGVTTGLVTEWLAKFGLQTQPNSTFNAVFLLTIYEPLLVFAGLLGLAFAFISKDLLRFAFAGWFIGALIFDLLMGGRPNGSMILAGVPLAFLAAFALVELWEGLQRYASWGNEGIIFAVGLTIAVLFYLLLTAWLNLTCQPNETVNRFAWLQCQFAWIPVAAILIIFGVIIVFFGLLSGWAAAVRGAAITGLVIGLLAIINIGWRLNYGPLMNLGYQPLARIPASTELVTLTETLAGESSVRAGDKTLLDITVIGSIHPALAWQLRDYANLTQADSVAGETTTSAVITPTPTDGSNNFGLGDAYVGQDFAVDAVWSPVGMQPKELIEWLIYRESGQRPDGQKVVLWLRF